MRMEDEKNPMADIITSVVWLHYYGPAEDLEGSAIRITRAISQIASVDTETVAHLVADAMYDPEAFESLNTEADETIADVLLQGVPVNLWTVGVPDIQRAKVDIVRENVHDKLVTLTEDPQAALEIVQGNLQVSISQYDKMAAFGTIVENLKKQDVQLVYVADDKWENLVAARSIAVRAGIGFADFRINRDHPDGSFPACRDHLRGWLGNEVSGKAVVFDVDDTVFDETGPDGRISKIAKIIARNLVAAPTR